MTRAELRTVASDRSGSTLLSVIGSAILLVMLACLPMLLNLYWMRVLTNLFMFAVLAQSINVIAGFVGYPAFGNVVFFGLGAYGMGVMVTQWQASAIAGLLVGLLLCGVTVLLIGPPLLRLRGHYFAIATLGLNEAVKAVVANLTDLTGGGKGLSLPLPEGSVDETARLFYWLFLLLGVLSILVALLLRSSRFLISAVLAGSAGALYADWLGYIDPPSVFDLTLAVKSFVMFLLGGAGTIFGPAIGAAMVELVATMTWSHLLQYHLGMLGIIIMTVAVIMPNGIQAFARDRAETIHRLLQRKV
jgi:branched-chain amino acid transport system permease protein